jgi:hypothetical protein
LDTYNINQDVQWATGPLLHQFSSIVLLPLILLVIAEVAIESLLAPGAVDWVCDWCKGRDRLVFAWVAEELYIPIR